MIHRYARRIGWFGILILTATSLRAQEVFRLAAPGITNPSMVVKNTSGLLIRDSAGQETLYQRDARFDDAAGGWTGFYARDVQQALQWPNTNQGAMRIGTLQADRQWRFQPSRMTIQSERMPGTVDASGVAVQRPKQPAADLVLPPNLPNVASGQLVPLNFNVNQAPIPIQLGYGDSDRRRYLSRAPQGGLTVIPSTSLGSRSWYIVPLANGLARVQYVDQGTILALGARSFSSPLDVYAIADRADQLWRIHPYPGGSGCYALESLQFPGHALTFQQNQLILAPIAYSPYQQWWPTSPMIPAVEPLYRSVQQQVIPNPPLPAAQVNLLNKHQEALIVLVADTRPEGAIQRFKIPAGGSQSIAMERDNGSTLIETFEVRSAYGAWDRREFRTPIPPSPIYDISVYEEFLQSIAIDRTGSSPNPIEDINYQPRSIGLLLVPPGAALPEQAALDLHAMAEAANNPGAVRRLTPKDYDSKTPPTDPLRDILREFQGQRGAF